MKKIEKMMQKYSSWEMITQEEFESARASMSEADFKFWYAIGPADKKPYKRELPQKEDLTNYILDKVHEDTNSMKGWVTMLGIFAIISLVFSLISVTAIM
ncbi:MAG: hypothetical protein ACOYJB_00685 [Christensenellaceae bacterium]|jgi:hypothetical protein